MQTLRAKPAGTPHPLDALMKSATKAIGLPTLTGAIYNKPAFFLECLMPETVKAGMAFRRQTSMRVP